MIDDDSLSVTTETTDSQEVGEVELEIDSGDSDGEEEVKGERSVKIIDIWLRY